MRSVAGRLARAVALYILVFAQVLAVAPLTAGDGERPGGLAGLLAPDAVQAAPGDEDDDGVADAEDNCPANPNPDQKDADDDGVGDECDGEFDFDASAYDADGDGFGWPDCDDTDPAVAPEAAEVADGIDNDCDGSVDEVGGCDNGNPYATVIHGDEACFYEYPSCGNAGADLDGDEVCAYELGGEDCNDADPSVYAEAPETNDGIDNDCDGHTGDGPPPPDPNDLDGDGVQNADDNCAFDANAGQEDADGDGVGDVCDNCPSTFNPTQEDVCTDTDGDGVMDFEDNCAVDGNAGQEDADGDGVGDVCDNCPEAPNADQADADGDGLGDTCEPPDTTAPTVSITSPAEDATYEVGDTATASYACDDEPDGSGLASCTATLDGAAFTCCSLPTDEPGTFTLAVTATDGAGNTTTVSRDYDVVSPPDTTAPTVSITSPAADASYEVGDTATASYSCDDEPDGSGVASCTATLDGAAFTCCSLPTDEPGTFTLAVTATDGAGNTTTVSRDYDVVIPPAPFTDIDDSIFGDEIAWLYFEEITRGCNAEGTLFCPGQSVTREQMASFLVRALDLPSTITDYFTDDEGSTFHEADINALREAGITLGCNAEGTLFCPGDVVTREQMASFISRALDLPTTETDYFTDDEDSTFHEADINRFREAGITLGCNAEGTQFCPRGVVTREQMAAFLFRAVGD